MIIPACVRCGFCCERSTCGYDVWDAENHRCASLEYGEDGRAVCKKYDEILQDPGQIVMPAFGYGCCSSINTFRRPIIIKHHGGITPMVEIEDF